MRIFLTVLLCLCIAILPGCALLQPDSSKAQVALQRVEEAYQRKEITKKQRDAAVEAIEADPQGFNWDGLLGVSLNVLLGVLGIPVTVGLGTQAFHKASAKARAKQP